MHHGLTRSIVAAAAIFALLVASSRALSAAPTIRLSATRMTVLSDGRDTTEIIAEIRDDSGRMAPDGAAVTFQTSLGTFIGNGTVQTRAGTARIRLVSPQKGTATVTVSTAGALAGGFQKLDILFTDDPTETFQGNTYVAVRADSSLLYSAVERIIEASGRRRAEPEKESPGARLAFRNIEVFADRLQLDCTANVVRAQGQILFRRGGRRLACSRLYYALMTGDGYAVMEVENRLRPVRLKGPNLDVEPMDRPVPPRFFELADLSRATLIVTAGQILLFPGEKLQFTRPTFYQDGQRLMAMPFYSMGLFSTQLFSDQFIRVGSQGLGLDLPIYYNLSPSSTGILSIRHGEQAGRGIYATRPGWTMDMIQSYNSLGSGQRYTGQLALTGFTQSDWGLRWNHSQEFSSDTRGSLSLDFPQHRSLFASSNFHRQMGGFYLGMNLSGNRSLRGFPSSGETGDVYLETTPRKVGATGYMMAVGATSGYTRFKAGDFESSSVTHGLQSRFYSRPFNLDRHTTLTNFITLGRLWSRQGNEGNSLMASLTATRALRNGSLQLTYDFTRQPTFITDGSHRLNLNFSTGTGSKWRLSLYGSRMLDAEAGSLIGDVGYSFAPRWRATLAATLQRFSFATYRDYEIGLARTIGGRELTLSYSTFSHRFYFNFQAGAF